MPYRVTAGFSYSIQEPSTILLSYLAHRSQQKIMSEFISVSPGVMHEELIIGQENNRFHRIKVPEAGELTVTYSADVQNCWRIVDFSNVSAKHPDEITPEIFPYLLPSRYCQSDQLSRFANHEFGSFDSAFDKVIAVTGWISEHVEYLSGSTNVNTSAFDTITQQAGVCRDFAHLGIALCRALTIPARYCTVYAYKLEPQDFHACFEAYIAHQWVLFDATRLAPLNGLVRIAIGRDAADVAVSNLFGSVNPDCINVDCTLTGETPEPFYYDRDLKNGICIGL